MKLSEPTITKSTEKTEQIAEDIIEFKKAVAGNFEIDDAVKIYEALDLMIEIHADQEPYSTGKPYASHPLSVANDLLNKYKIGEKDLIIAALLHDSIEDQSLKLQAKRISRLKNEDIIGPSPKHDALLELRDLFGDRVKKVVARLTNPNFKKIIRDLKLEGIDKTRDELYFEHIQGVISDTDAFIVKFSDFMRNAEAISNLPETNKGEIERKENFKHKYEPVIKNIFLPYFRKIENNHPLYPYKKQGLKELKELFNKDYA